MLSTVEREIVAVLVCAPSLSSHRLEPNLCGIGSRGCAFESGMRHIHIFFLYDRVFDRSWNRMPDVAREATLLQRHGYDLGHERPEDVCTSDCETSVASTLGAALCMRQIFLENIR